MNQNSKIHNASPVPRWLPSGHSEGAVRLASLTGDSTTPLAISQVVSALDWSELKNVAPEELSGKKLICQLNGLPFDFAQRKSFRKAADTVGLWIVRSELAASQAAMLGLTHLLRPPLVDSILFRERSEPEKKAQRSALGIPAAAFVIGNFDRRVSPSSFSGGDSHDGADLFLEILRELKKDGVPVHALISGQRRIALVARLSEEKLPFSFIGEDSDRDEFAGSMLPDSRVAKLYGVLDLCLGTGIWEGSMDLALESAVTGTPALFRRVDGVEEILESDSQYSSLQEALEKISRERRTKQLSNRSASIRQKALAGFSGVPKPAGGETCEERLKTIPPFSSKQNLTHAGQDNSWWDKGRAALGFAPSSRSMLTVSIFREFVKPPYGGGNQFMLALKDAFERRGVRVLVNEVSSRIDGYYLDSLWFDETLLPRLEKIARPLVVHRIDGPIHLYRGKDKHLDDSIFALNQRFATATVLQSEFTLEKVIGAGYRPVNPVLIHNAANPAIFHAGPARPRGPKLKIIATSWSDNAIKGGPAYKWLEENLDWDKYDFTFVGRCSEKLTRAKQLKPVPSELLATMLRDHDVYFTASQNDPCSNALIEAMSCGLPVFALRSGGHPELVGNGGLCFDRHEEIPDILLALEARYDAYRSLLAPPSIDNVAERYLSLIRDA
jgi:glycosyltransferase involved in cell wall biosynthesis